MQQLLPVGWAWNGKLASFSFCTRHIHRRFSRARPAGQSLDLLRSWPCFPCNDSDSQLVSSKGKNCNTETPFPISSKQKRFIISFWESCLFILIIILYHTLCGHRHEESHRKCSYSSKISQEETLSSPQQFDLLHWLVHRSLDSLSFTAKAFTLLPAHLHKHSEPQILHCQFKLFVFWVVWVSAFLQVKTNKIWNSGKRDIFYCKHLILSCCKCLLGLQI